MKKRALPVSGKALLAVAVAASLGVIGISYAAWSDTLHITQKLSTGMFQLAFSQDGQEYAAAIVNAEGDLMEDLPGVEAESADKGTSVEVTFQNGLPLDQLLEGNMVKITCPLSKEDSVATDAKRYEADFTVPWKTVELAPQTQSLVLDGCIYTADAIPAEYSAPLYFDVYRSFEGDEESLTGSLYFKLTDGSCRQIQKLPHTIKVSEETLEADRTDTGSAASDVQDGVLVVYTCTVPVGLDQNNAEDGIARVVREEAGT